MCQRRSPPEAVGSVTNPSERHERVVGGPMSLINRTSEPPSHHCCNECERETLSFPEPSKAWSAGRTTA